ncbi:hypothetical protein C4K04_2060 [Pseudomonas chlororaphis]|jgi:hypothetical protein|uniref:Uncharacterized protein n=1 Tax=Pseudomonas chlororaphis TaxID=587753 RepID=A0A3G7TKW2_9PSED|nr:hypothetical protein [Pseudomonas chlororaphis]AZE47744.1 hypothetical protein C4K04_2060 [Pseudomonas chlororaphis]
MKYGMANREDLIKKLHDQLKCGDSLIDLDDVRSYVSSPRLFDVTVRGFKETLAFVGDTFLDQRSMLADWPQRTHGISLERWQSVSSGVALIEDFPHNDTSISKIQVWAFEPSSLCEEQMRLAVALSYTTAEFRAESRIVGALNHVLNHLGFYVDGDRY